MYMLTKTIVVTSRANITKTLISLTFKLYNKYPHSFNNFRRLCLSVLLVKMIIISKNWNFKKEFWFKVPKFKWDGNIRQVNLSKYRDQLSWGDGWFLKGYLWICLLSVFRIFNETSTEANRFWLNQLYITNSWSGVLQVYSVQRLE